MQQNTAHFRFYAELNDFLPQDKKQTTFCYRFNGKPSIKDAIEALGVPHTEVDLILVNGKSVQFDHHLLNGDRVSIYPVFEGLNISPVIRLRQKPLRTTKFVLDVHLGRLARYLRMLGFDTFYRNDYKDSDLVRLSVAEKRIILTRDQGILKNKAVTHGYWLRSTNPKRQIQEVLQRFDLFSEIKPFHRCLICNGKIARIAKKVIKDQLPAKTAHYFDEFYHCQTCGKIYWKGSHYDKMTVFLNELSKTVVKRTC